MKKISQQFTYQVYILHAVRLVEMHYHTKSMVKSKGTSCMISWCLVLSVWYQMAADTGLTTRLNEKTYLADLLRATEDTRALLQQHPSRLFHFLVLSWSTSRFRFFSEAANILFTLRELTKGAPSSRQKRLACRCFPVPPGIGSSDDVEFCRLKTDRIYWEASKRGYSKKYLKMQHLRATFAIAKEDYPF